ncbi:hypothetical protein GCM10027570_25020 [Streptomonospora sediminis]
MTTPTTPPATTTEQSAPTGRGWRRLLPAPTPAARISQPRPIPGWAAFVTFAISYGLVFGPWVGMVWPAPPVPTTLDTDLWAVWAVRQWTIHGVYSVVVLGLAVAVTRRLGLRLSDIGIRPKWTRESAHPRRQAWAVFTWVLAAYTAATVLKMAAAPLTGGGTMDEAHPLGFALATLPIHLTTSWVEETLGVALLVLLVTAARQPLWVALIVTAAAKIVYHLYMGPGAIAVVLPALVCVWLYHRTGRLTPIIAAHAAHNLCGAAVTIAAFGL